MSDKFRIAVVDDELELLDNIICLLEENKEYQVVGFTDPVEALRRLRDEAPDLLITDISMPNMGGLDLLASLRVNVPDLPAIVLSAYVDVDSCLKALRLGVMDVIEKPYKNEELLDSVALGARVGRARAKIARVLRDPNSNENAKILDELYDCRQKMFEKARS